MTAYILRRIIQTLVVVFVLSFVAYALMGLMPGDPLDLACQANPNCTTETLDQMKAALGLDRPIHERYLTWLGNFIQGDLGYSRTYRVPVADILVPRLINTAILGGLAVLVSLLIAIPLGVLAGLKPGTKVDYAVNLFAFAGISVPSFWLGLMLIIVFAVWLGWFPAGGIETVGVTHDTWWAMVRDRAQYLVLPVMSLSLLTIAQWVRYTRSSLMETMRLDFIRTARAKGITNARVILMHGLRNALIPVVTIIALSFSFIFSGSLITETVFAYQGAGKLIFDSIMANDYNVAICSFIITSSLVMVMNLIADIGYAYLDPRISYK